MPEIRMRPKHQITLPASVVKAAKIEIDDRMQVEYLNGVILITPKGSSTPKLSAISFAGAAKGLWGKNPAMVEKGVRDLRDSWER